MPFHRRLACKLNYFQSIILMFAAVILIGAALLMLPISAQERTVTPFHEALFTATSAVCVTGLVVRDTASHWSAFGQAVLMVLIQIGGLGVITVGASFSLLSGRRISLSQRGRMQEAMSAPKVGGIVRLTGFVIRTSLMIEGIGALCMLPVFCRDFGVSGIWKAVFHSVSAFCNAGFDLMGTPDMPFVSLTAYRADPVISLTISALIVVGGIGFLTWDDVRCNRLCFHRYRLQSKVILTSTALLILLPTLYFFCFEFKGSTAGAAAALAVPVRNAPNSGIQYGRLYVTVQQRARPYHSADVHRRFTGFYGGRHQDNNGGSACRQCVCCIPQAEKPRNVRAADGRKSGP